MVTEKMIEALKPCPFCGYELTTSEGICEGFVEDSEEEDVEFTGICCPGCAVFLPKQTEDGTAIEGIQAWNRRAEAALSTDAEPVMFVSEKQLGAVGDYLPTRKTAEGNFQLALYAAPPAPSVASLPDVGEWTDDDRAKAWRDAFDTMHQRAMKAEAALSSSEPMKPDFFEVEEIREQKLATVAAPDNGTTAEVLAAVLECAEAWVPEARIIGNVRAGDIARVVRTALSAQVQDVAEYERREQACKETALSQWERSLKRPDLAEKDRVIGAIEAYKRQAFVFAFPPAAPAAKQGEAE